MIEYKTPFWLVWCKYGGVPVVPHLSKRSAEDEAVRLATNNPGQHFVVLAAVSGYEATRPVKEVCYTEPF